MPLTLFGFLIAGSAAAHLWADYAERRSLAYVFKPLTTILILVVALNIDGTQGDLYRWLIGAGLLCSLAGDVFLMLPGDRFVPGLGSFLGAQVCYVVAFSLRAGFPVSPVAAGLFLAYGLGLVFLLWPHLGRYKIPVVVYGLALVSMGWTAMEAYLETGTEGALYAAVGACLFIVSDSILAWNRFARFFRSAQFLIMTTYVLAQFLIAISISGR